ncbi:MAG: hypothetical protein AB1408_12230 [Pseudomonadota bacterium]
MKFAVGGGGGGGGGGTGGGGGAGGVTAGGGVGVELTPPPPPHADTVNAKIIEVPTAILRPVPVLAMILPRL